MDICNTLFRSPSQGISPALISISRLEEEEIKQNTKA